PATALTRAIAAALVAAIIIAACDNPSPTPSPAATTSSTPGASAGPSPTVQPSATAVAASEFPLAVVTGLTNLKAVVSVDEIGALAAAGKLVVPCGVTIQVPAITSTAACVAAAPIAAPPAA